MFDGSGIRICAFRDKFIDYIYWREKALAQRECKFPAEKFYISFSTKC